MDGAKIVLIVGRDLHAKLKVDGNTWDSGVKELAAESYTEDVF